MTAEEREFKRLLTTFACVFAIASAVASNVPSPSAELRHHLSLKAETVPYRFVFEKPADAPAPGPFESHYRVDGDTVWFWGDDGGGA